MRIRYIAGALAVAALTATTTAAQVWNYGEYQVGTHTVTVNVYVAPGGASTSVYYSEGWNTSALVHGGAPVMNGNVVGTNSADPAEIPGTNGGTAGGKNLNVKIKKGQLWYETASGAWLPARPAMKEQGKTTKKSTWGFRGGVRPGDDVEIVPRAS